MPFVFKKYPAIKGKKIQLFLLHEVGMSMSMAQKTLAKKRVFNNNGHIIENSQILECEYVKIYVFEGHTRGLKPIVEKENFALFDKPSGLMVHPVSRSNKYTLLDEIKYHFGDDANLAHRIDRETSGLVLVSKNKNADRTLKRMFENRYYQKEYLAIVQGEIKQSITINKPISKDNGKINIKMTTKNYKGKDSCTFVTPIKYNNKSNTTLIKAVPYTGRQHQIRVHLDSIGHRILGDPIYGIEEEISNEYLLKKLSSKNRLRHTGANRLMLQANRILFTYDGVDYDILSKLILRELITL